ADSHIAIVHIDGNDVGERFKQTSNLKAIRILSKTVHEATEKAFDAVIEKTVEKYDKIMEALGLDSERAYPTIENKNILPIRSIVLGGDDVTFVCDGKLGIYFAKIFIEEFEKQKVNGEKLTACAGVAIIKTKYPFYRGYWLAEELCTNAKRERKDEKSAASFLDFHVSLGSIGGSLKMIRQRDFENRPQGSLLYRPFKIVPKDPFDELGLNHFLEKVSQLDLEIAQRLKIPDYGLPKNKINELREVLTLTEDAAREFVRALQYRGWKLPHIEGRQYQESLFADNKTPYFDMIEILRFYPEFALEENGEKA
ncbi:MAG: Cas10/Cmr2 second palm domain-containing protein, partial [bacterium]